MLAGDCQGVAVLDCCTAPASFAHAPGAVLTRRPSAFQAGHIPSRYGSCECYALSPGAAGCPWLQLSLSLLLSTRCSLSGSKPTRTVQGMVRIRPGRLSPGPCLLTGVPAVVSRVKRDLACAFTRHLPCACCPAVAVTLEAGGAGTYTRRAIPGAGPSLDSCAFCPPRGPFNLWIPAPGRLFRRAAACRAARTRWGRWLVRSF
jgi:hypothetical protein